VRRGTPNPNVFAGVLGFAALTPTYPGILRWLPSNPPFVVSLSNHVRQVCRINILYRSSFDKPVLSEVEGLRTNGIKPRFIK